MQIDNTSSTNIQYATDRYNDFLVESYNRK